MPRAAAAKKIRNAPETKPVPLRDVRGGNRSPAKKTLKIKAFLCHADDTLQAPAAGVKVVRTPTRIHTLDALNPGPAGAVSP